MRLLKRTLAGSAATLIPLGIFLVGIGMFEYGWQIGMGSILAAYLAYRAISWQAWRWSFVEMRAVDRGEFFERIAALARTAQVKLRGVYITSATAFRVKLTLLRWPAGTSRSPKACCEL